MNVMRLIAVILIVLGILGLIYGGFSYTKQEQAAKIGPVEVNVKRKKHVNVPVWAGVGAIVVGAVLLASAGRGSK